LQPQPNLAGEIRAKMPGTTPGTRLDAGMASFACDRDGQRFSAAVVAATYLFDPTGVGGNWQVLALFGFRTPQGQEAAASQVLAHMRQSYKLNPQWEAALTQAGQQEEEDLRRQGAALAQQPAPSYQPPVTYQPQFQPIYRPSAGPRCDDLQQQRICTVNDGRLVSSGGCLVCVGP
jgi:hypothetical protein